MTQHASDKDENIEYTLRTWFASSAPAGVLVFYGNRSFDDPERQDTYSQWLVMDIVRVAGWIPSDPTIIQVEVYGRVADDPFGRSAANLRDKVKEIFDVAGGIPLRDFAANPSTSNPPEVGSNFNLFVRHVETAQNASLNANDAEALHRYSLTFHVYHWRVKNAGY